MHILLVCWTMVQSRAEMPQLPMSISSQGRAIIRDLEAERGLTKVGELFDFSKSKTGLSYISARVGKDQALMVRNVEAASEGTVVRRTYTIPATALPVGPTRVSRRLGRQGETLIRVEALEPRPGVSFVASDTFGMEAAGQRQLRIRREHVDGQSRYTINKNELSFGERPWRPYRTSNPDEVILDATVTSKGAKVVSYNKATDTYAQTNITYDVNEKDLDPVVKSREVLSLENAKSMGVVAELKTLPPVKTIGTDMSAPSGMHTSETPDPNSAR